MNTVVTVTTARTTPLLVTLAAFKAEVPDSGLSDAMLTTLLTRASAEAEKYVGRIFALETVAEVMRPARSLPVLVLARAPVTTVAAVTVGDTALDPSDFELIQSPGFLYRLQGDPRVAWPPAKLTIEYSAGFDPIPADVQDAIVRLVRGRLFAKDRDPAVRQESIPGVRDVSYWIATGDEAGNMPPDVTDILDNYIRPALG